MCQTTELIGAVAWPNNSRAHWASGAPGRGQPGVSSSDAAMRSAKRRKLRPASPASPASCDFGVSVRFEDHWYVELS